MINTWQNITDDTKDVNRETLLHDMNTHAKLVYDHIHHKYHYDISKEKRFMINILTILWKICWIIYLPIRYGEILLVNIIIFPFVFLSGGKFISEIKDFYLPSLYNFSDIYKYVLYKKYLFVNRNDYLETFDKTMFTKYHKEGTEIAPWQVMQKFVCPVNIHGLYLARIMEDKEKKNGINPSKVFNLDSSFVYKNEQEACYHAHDFPDNGNYNFDFKYNYEDNQKVAIAYLIINPLYWETTYGKKLIEEKHFPCPPDYAEGERKYELFADYLHSYAGNLGKKYLDFYCCSEYNKQPLTLKTVSNFEQEYSAGAWL